MIAACTKCRGLYEASEAVPLEPVHHCPRCTAVGELLAAATALHAEVKGRLEAIMRGEVRTDRANLVALVEQTGEAIAAARAV